MPRIQTDRGRGVYRRFGIRSPRQELSEIDARVYPVTITEPTFQELASLRHQGLNAGRTLGTNWDAFDPTPPIAAGTVLAEVLLSRGLYSVGGILEGTESGPPRLCSLELVTPGAVVVSRANMFLQSGAAAPIGGGAKQFGPMPLWNDTADATLRLQVVELPTATTRIAGVLWVVRHFSDVQDGSE